MKLSLQAILNIEEALSPSMARIVQGSKDFAKGSGKTVNVKSLLPIVLSDLVKLKKASFKVTDQKLKTSLANDITRIIALMNKLNIHVPPNASV